MPGKTRFPMYPPLFLAIPANRSLKENRAYGRGSTRHGLKILRSYNQERPLTEPQKLVARTVFGSHTPAVGVERRTDRQRLLLVGSIALGEGH
jgi:hypothetical protein